MRESLVSHNYDKFDKLDENTQNFLIKLAELAGAWIREGTLEKRDFNFEVSIQN